ncbi:MAG: GNAT family N-acetyltransferase [Lentisphaeria bacterium]|nr:GNAT family N-acetyltransferase [Lentisphaeria bacterium]
MTPAERDQYPEREVALKNGRRGRLRFLRQDDGDRLGDLYEGLPEEAGRFYWPHPLDREHARGNAARADSPTEVVLVLELEDGSLGGYAWYRWRGNEARASGFGICVAGPCQGCGAGRVLMERLLEVAGRVGPPVMSLTCQHANARAVELYLKLGFRVIREGIVKGRRQWPAEPQYWMERRRR